MSGISERVVGTIRRVQLEPREAAVLAKDRTIATLHHLITLPREEGFGFLRDFALGAKSPSDLLNYGNGDRLARLQYNLGHDALYVPEVEIEMPVAYGTWSADMRFGDIEVRKMNEDALLLAPFGEGRVIAAVFDGASSQRPIAGLERYGVRGAWYVSHLASLGFPQSEAFADLSRIPNSSAYEVMTSLNDYLGREMRKVDGVDYSDPLTIPGMAGTIAVIDLNNLGISIAHAADTIGLAQYTDGFRLLTDNRNASWDEETQKLVDRIVLEAALNGRQITPREAKDDPRIKEQLAASFRAKINTTKGTGIINGMRQLVSNKLIHTDEIEITPDLEQVSLASDGIHMPWTGRKDLDDETMYRKLLGALDSPYYRPTNPLYQALVRLELDPEFKIIRRLGSHDDATFLTLNFEQGQGHSEFRQVNHDLVDQDISEIVDLRTRGK